MTSVGRKLLLQLTIANSATGMFVQIVPVSKTRVSRSQRGKQSGKQKVFVSDLMDEDSQWHMGLNLPRLTKFHGVLEYSI